MKFAKIFLASFLLLAVASAFIAPKSHAKKFTTKYYEYTETNNDFVISTGTDARLQSTSDWTVQTSQPSTLTGTGKIYYFTIIYTVGGGASEPTEQNILDALATKYNDAGSSGHTFSFDSGNTFTITDVASTGTDVQYTLTEKL